jgi:hypothetical protein
MQSICGSCGIDLSDWPTNATTHKCIGGITVQFSEVTSGGYVATEADKLRAQVAALAARCAELEKALIDADAICCGALEAGQDNWPCERVQEVIRAALADETARKTI